MTTSRFADALRSPNMRAFLHMIRVGEGTPDTAGYRRLFGGEMVESLFDHPRKAVTKSLGGKPLTSTAAGAYQFLSRTWDECAKALGLTDFTPASQDLAAVFLIHRRGALDDVLAGRVESAIAKCAREWASLPGSPYGQPVKTLAQALTSYRAAGGDFAPAPLSTTETVPTAPKEKPVPFPAIIAALLPSLISAVPELTKAFRPGDEKAERNAAAAATVFKIAQTALGATNEQDTIQKIESDPKAAEVVREAIKTQWFDIVEAGGGGIDGARKADAVYATNPQVKFWRSPSFWALIILVPMAYMIVGSISGLWGYNEWSPDVRAAISTAVISLVLGGAAGYYWGSTTSKNTPASSAGQ